MAKCEKCNYPLDPWGECIRCPSKADQQTMDNRCKGIKIAVLRALKGGNIKADVMLGAMVNRGVIDQSQLENLKKSIEGESHGKHRKNA